MQNSTTIAMHLTDADRVASQANTRRQTAARPYTINCGRPGCPVVFVFEVGTDWYTLSRLISRHNPVCTGGLYGLDLLHPPSDTHSAQNAPSPPLLAPGSSCLHNGNHSAPNVPSPPLLVPESSGLRNGNHNNEVVVLSSKQRKKEDKRREKLESDQYAGDVRPTSVRCRGCNKDICLDRRSRFYSGLWLKHRGKCPGILRMKQDHLARSERGFCPQNTGHRTASDSRQLI
ncbi:hypothetical protein EDB19DRAFT_1775961 [Suillus lakei]|nr:hypothetical protein EDB19DRAFT_1775961 [Suillus lakei]